MFCEHPESVLEERTVCVSGTGAELVTQGRVISKQNPAFEELLAPSTRTTAPADSQAWGN